MLELNLVLGVLFMHWFADFVMQTDWQAQNKSKRMLPLVAHTAVYSLFWLWLGVEFAAITFVAHTATDYVTSRINSRLWAAQKVHWFFVSVGFDQFLHYAQLFLTYKLLN